jgi:hypothetical protein
MRAFAFLILSICLCSSVHADTRIVRDGCVKYLATDKSYNVEVQIVDGEDLWPKYSWANVLTKYAIVFWSQEEATVIDIGVFGLNMDTGVQGKDLQGREWKVAKYPWC